MERKIDLILEKWKHSTEKKPLIITGCRQIGKTYSVRNLGKKYESFIELNLEDNPSQRDLFTKDISAESFIEKLSFIENVKIIPGNTLLFIDEIQAFPDALSSLKPLAESKKIDVIASGSLLGVKLNESSRLSPLGYTKTIEMYSMDFEEFLWALGVNKKVIEDIKHNIRNELPLDKFTLEKTTDLFKKYLVIGGFPEAVLAYANSKDYNIVLEKLEWIKSVIYRDISKYSVGIDVLLLQSCLESVPSQLASENRRFVYRDIEKKSGRGKREYAPSIEWLIHSGLIVKCNSLNEPKLPLKLRENSSLFKIYLSDTGILSVFLGPDATSIVSNSSSNNGALMENGVCSALIRNKFVPRYFATKDGRLEVDFVISDGKNAIAIEVKSGKTKQSKSLLKLKEKDYGVSKFIKVCEGNIEYDVNGVLHLPLFAPCFFDVPDANISDEIDYIDSLNNSHN